MRLDGEVTGYHFDLERRAVDGNVAIKSNPMDCTHSVTAVCETLTGIRRLQSPRGRQQYTTSRQFGCWGSNGTSSKSRYQYPHHLRARRFRVRRSATLDGGDRCETITGGRKEPSSNSAYPLHLQSLNSHNYIPMVSIGTNRRAASDLIIRACGPIPTPWHISRKRRPRGTGAATGLGARRRIRGGRNSCRGM